MTPEIEAAVNEAMAGYFAILALGGKGEVAMDALVAGDEEQAVTVLRDARDSIDRMLALLEEK